MKADNVKTVLEVSKFWKLSYLNFCDRELVWRNNKVLKLPFWSTVNAATDITQTFRFRADAQNSGLTEQAKQGSNAIRVTTEIQMLLGRIHNTEHKHTIQTLSTVLYATSSIEMQDTLHITVCLVLESILLLQLHNTNTVHITQKNFWEY